MASSSVSQEDVEVDFEISSRRSRIRTARARNINPGPTSASSRPGVSPPTANQSGEADEECGGGFSDRESGTAGVPGSGIIASGGLYPAPLDHDASPKPATRLKEKRMIRANHTNKGKQQRDRRKLREKRRSTGVVHIPSTESTGGSTGEDEELMTMTAETRRNTHYNEHIEKAAAAAAAAAAATVKYQGVEQTSSSTASSNSGHDHKQKKAFTPLRNKSPSDLEADDEDNQDYDSLTMSDSTLSLVHPQQISNLQQSSHQAHSGNNHQPQRSANGRPPTPTSENLDELLESAREENRRLLCLLEERDRRISSLETRLTQVTADLYAARNERSTLRQENNALIRAMSGLTAK